MSYSFAFVSAALRKEDRKHPILYGMENEYKRMTINCIESTIRNCTPTSSNLLYYYTIYLWAFCTNPRNKMAFKTYKQGLRKKFNTIFFYADTNIAFKSFSKK